MNETESLCRICLREDARTPIYEDSNCESGSNSTILTKLTLCLNDKFEEAPGHPRYICDSCLDTLNMVFHFINKYKETCKILQERLEHVKEVIKLDETDEFVFPEYYTLDDGDFCPEDNTFDAFEPKEKKIKIEFEDSTCFIEKLKSICKLNTAEKSNTNKNFEEEVPHVKAKHNQLRKLKNNRKKEIVETGQDKNFIKIEFKQKTTKSFTSSYKYQTNRIMSSLLEGVFVWDGDDWSPGTLPPKNASNGELKSKNPQENDERDPQQPTKTNERMAPDPVLCPMCGKTFPNQFNLRNHVEMHTNVQCSLCNAKIVKGSLRRHMKTKHSSTKNFICNVCGKGFALYGQMDVHIKGVHEKSLPRRPKRRLPCELCDKDFITKKLLLIHGRAAHTGERPAVCTVCNASFYHEDYLKEHTRLHTGECPFECPVCGRGYPHLGNMKSHMKNHRVSELSEETLSTIKPSWFKYLRPCKLQPQAVRISSSALEGVISTKIREMNGQEMKRIRSGRNRQGWLSPAEAEQRELLMGSARAWMELAPTAAAAEPATVEVGQPTRLLVQCTLPVGVGMRVTNCVAHDGLGEASQRLLDEAGCPVDETIFDRPTVHHHKHRSSEIDFSDLEPADLQRNIEEKTNLKLAKSDPEYMLKNIMTYQHAVTTFAAFKFPDRAKLHLTCGIELCKGHCPVVDCKALQKPQQTRDGLVRKARLDKDAKGVVIDRLEVFNSIEVLAPNIELEDEASIRGSRRIESEEEDFVRGFSPGDKTICLSPGKMALAFCVLGVIFLCAIAVAFASLVRARRRGRDPPHTSLSFYTGSKSLFSSSESSSSGLSGSKLLLTDSPYLDQHSSSSNNWPYSRAF